MTKKKTFIIADDHPLILAGNKAFLEDKGYLIKGTAKNGNEAFNIISKEQPDFAILDMDMPVLSGIEVAKACKAKKYKTKIIILSLYKSQEIKNVVGKTIEGYVLKEDALSELLLCIKTISSNKNYVSSTLRKTGLYDSKNKDIEKLTITEIKILKYLNKNLSSAQIANELFISKRTVEKHRSNIIKKLKLDSSNQNALILWLKNHPEIFND